MFTSIDRNIFGYENNVNLKADGACPVPCEWITDDWQENCLRGFSEPPCVTQLLPEYVYENIKQLL